MVSQSQEELDSNPEESDGGNADKTPTLAQAIDASSILLGFLENFNWPRSISEPDKMQIFRIQTIWRVPDPVIHPR